MRDFIKERGIEEVVHFSTINGIIGILDSGFLKSRERIRDDQRLEFILKLNAAFRKDVAWLDYVNLSLTRINDKFFSVSSGSWHRDTSWGILSFSQEIICHEGVYFTTTNNFYPSVIRGVGLEGLEGMFSEKIRGRYGVEITRAGTLRPSETTDVQAEVLYPGQVSIDYLRRIYVRTEEDQDNICGVVRAFSIEGVEVLVEPAMFEVII